MKKRKIDINKATVTELTSLKGIGFAKAKAIVHARKTLKGFKSLSDLLGIAGIGDNLLSTNLETIICSTSAHTNVTPPIRQIVSVALCPLYKHLPIISPTHKPRRCYNTRSSIIPSNLPDPATDIKTPSDVKLDLCSLFDIGQRNETNRIISENLSEPNSDIHFNESMLVPSLESEEPDQTYTPNRRVKNLRGKGVERNRRKRLEDGVGSGKVFVKKSRIPSKENPQPELHQWLHTFQTWDNAERLLALDELITTCDQNQVRHVLKVIEPQFQRDFISLLPKELALYVLSFLEPKDLLRAAQTCSYWHTLAEDSLLWKEKCIEEGVNENLVFQGTQGPGTRKGLKKFGEGMGWKGLYMRQRLIEKNWKNCAFRSIKILKGHDDHVITCLEFCGNKIVSGSDDNTLKVWSSITGRCLRTLTGHTGGVWSSQMSGSIIISGSTDRSLKVWNADTGQCKHTLLGHTSTVRCMHLHNKVVVSGSRDATLRMWNIDTGECMHVLIGHVAAVRCVQYDGNKVISGAYDFMVRIWDPETETCLQTLSGHTNRVYSLQFDGIHIVSGSLDTSIRVWNAETGSLLHTLVGHTSLTSGMELKDNILVSGNADSTVKVWNIETGQCLQTLQGTNKHQSAVTCLQFNRRLIITSSDDGTVKIWDMKTGEFLNNLITLHSGGRGGVVWRIRCNNLKLVCAVGSRNGTEETKLLVLDFDVDDESTTGQTALPPIM